MNTNHKFSVTILGNASAIPTENHHPASQLVIYKNKYFLLDCGEGTQMQLIKYNLKYHRIDNIFISHMHGDHFFGLIGLISTYNLLGREKSLHIHGPDTLKESIINILNASYTRLKYDLIFHNLVNNCITPIYEDKQLLIYSFPLNHRIPTWGFRFNEKTKQHNIKKKFVEEYNPSIEDIISIKAGNNFIDSERNIIKNTTITHSPPPLLSYAYCSDTKYDESIIDQIKGVTLLYHEATFDNSMKEIANEKFHSTAKDAASIAKKADVGKLVLGHFSARYKDLNNLLDEAQKVFNPTIISEEGMRYDII